MPSGLPVIQEYSVTLFQAGRQVRIVRAFESSWRKSSIGMAAAGTAANRPRVLTISKIVCGLPA